MSKPNLSIFRYRPSLSQVITLLVIAIPTIIFLELAEDIWQHEGFWWDEWIASLFYSWHHPWLNQFVRFITFTGGTGAYFLCAALAIGLLQRAQTQRAAILLFAFLGSGLLNLLLKLLFIRPRPTFFTPLLTVSGYSFPSGHTVAGITLFGVLAIFLWQDRRYGWAAIALVWALLVGVSRVYLGVHYPSDVLAGWMAGMLWIWVSFTLVRWNRLGEKNNDKRTKAEQDQLVSHAD